MEKCFIYFSDKNINFKYNMQPGFFFARLFFILIAAFTFPGCSYFGQGPVSAEDSITYYTQLINELPEEPAVYYNRGVFYFRTEKYKEAIADFSNALRVSPGFYQSYLPRGDCQRLLGNYAEAASNYDSCIRRTGANAYVYNSRAYCYFRLKKFDAAAADYSQVLLLGNGTGETYLQLGISLYKTGNYEKAAGNLVQSVKMSPDSGAGYLWLANAEYKLGMLDSSIAHYLQAVDKKAVFNVENHEAEAYLKRGVELKDEDQGLALQYLNSSILADSSNGRAFIERARLYRVLNEKELAYYDYKKAGTLGLTEAFSECKSCCEPDQW